LLRGPLTDFYRTGTDTGNNRSVGLAIVELLARKSYHVVVASRDCAAGCAEGDRLSWQSFRVELFELDAVSQVIINAALSV
jgi:NAD(P)-dependent dehydrogenase (short-subunit alcohol dehydrogenase family)